MRTSQKITAAAEAGDSIERVIHMQTMYLGPDELLVAMKVGVHSSDTATEVAEAIDEVEARVREAIPTVTALYIEPDIYRTDHTPRSARVAQAPEES